MNQDIRYYFKKEKETRQLLDVLREYDIISFDVFDTAIYRKVVNPLDIFELLAIKMGFPDFKRIRKKAEMETRELNEKVKGIREVSLCEIYDTLEKKYNIDISWMQKEIELEYRMTVANPNALRLYRELLDDGKKIVFTTDMYLPLEAIKKILESNGYDQYDRIMVSNIEGARKGDGSLQKILKNLYAGKKIIHIGDNYEADVVMSERVGLTSYYYPRDEIYTDTDYKDVLFGSFYHSIIRNCIYNDEWEENIYYEHGFRVAGVLAAGYAKFIDEVARQKKVDKILFCARDCDVIYKVFRDLFPIHSAEYIQISRYAIMCATNERYLDDLIIRTVLKYVSIYGKKKTIVEVLVESGFDYLVPYLEEDDIERFMFASAVGNKVVEDFFYNHFHIIKSKLYEDTLTAAEYFDKKIGGATRVLVVDVGWSGTCITALKYFLQKSLQKNNLQVFGTLMCTSRAYSLKNGMEDGTISAYVYSPYHNFEYMEYMMPQQKTVRENDLLHMPLEYMFTSTSPSLIRYIENKNNSFLYSNIIPDNAEEIEEMQKGIIDFCIKLKEYMGEWFGQIKGSPRVAIIPFFECLEHKSYCYEVYKNFVYDDAVTPFSDREDAIRFGDLFIEQTGYSNDEMRINKEEEKRKILFVTPELTYTGTPRSMLRMCLVARNLGYKVVVWSMQRGPFIKEYESRNIEIHIVPEKKLCDIEEYINQFDMAICNTIVTDKYAKVCEKYIPTIWFIREATNIPDFCRNNEERFRYLQECQNIYCVSEYAANAIRKFTNNSIKVLHNCVEDETDMASSYIVGTSNKIKFVQFGTIEYRKGYDVLIAAYFAMPKEYQAKAEVYFAGGFINSGMPFCSYIFGEIEDCESIHYLGVVKGEKNKIETLSAMDVVVVASRDESCSLVALEGAMLSKPLIVTENVGAKYMIEGGNGYIVRTNDVEDLKKAMMRMIEQKSELKEMGDRSRENYNKYASMSNHIQDLEKIYSLTENKGKYEYTNNLKQEIASENIMSHEDVIESLAVVISMYATFEQIEYVFDCIQSLLNQTYRAEKILLCLDEKEFMGKELPEQLSCLLYNNPSVEVIWINNGKGILNRYLQARKRYFNNPVIIVNSDVEYSSNLVETLVRSYLKHPDCISCTRAELMMFRKKGEMRTYKRWIHNYKILKDIPSYQLMPVGLGGVLYPPDKFVIEDFETEDGRVLIDDFILKVNAVNKNIYTVLTQTDVQNKEIAGTEELVLSRRKKMLDMYDDHINKVLLELDKNRIDVDKVLNRIRQDRFVEIRK